MCANKSVSSTSVIEHIHNLAEPGTVFLFLMHSRILHAGARRHLQHQATIKLIAVHSNKRMLIYGSTTAEKYVPQLRCQENIISLHNRFIKYCLESFPNFMLIPVNLCCINMTVATSNCRLEEKCNIFRYYVSTSDWQLYSERNISQGLNAALPGRDFLAFPA